MNILLSIPRSGNTFTRYCVEWLSKRPTLGCKKDDSGVDKPIYLRVDISIDNFSPILTKCHSVKSAKKYINGDKLVVLIRNPSQAFGSSKERSANLNEKNWVKNYLDILKFYHDYENKKLIVYYEDLKEKPKVFLNSLAEFLDLNKNKINQFITDIDKHKEKAAKSYHTNLISKDNIKKYQNDAFSKYTQQFKNSKYFEYIRRYYD